MTRDGTHATRLEVENASTLTAPKKAPSTLGPGRHPHQRAVKAPVLRAFALRLYD